MRQDVALVRMSMWAAFLLPFVHALPRVADHVGRSSSPQALNGSSWMVVVSDTSPPQEHWAAEQLANFLGRWLSPDGQPLELGTPADATFRPAAFVGAAATTGSGAVSPSTLRTLGSDAFWCQSRSSSSAVHAEAPRLFLTGGINGNGTAEPRGTINAVFEYPLRNKHAST